MLNITLGIKNSNKSMTDMVLSYKTFILAWERVTKYQHGIKQFIKTVISAMKGDTASYEST